MARNGSGVYTPPATSFPEVSGTLIEAARFNETINDIATALTGSLSADGQTTATGNQPMSGYRHTGVGNGSARNDYPAIGQVQDGKLNWVDGGGTADAITATYVPPVTALVDGQLCCVRATAANATTTPTFSPNGLTARTIVRDGGGALASGDIAGDGHELMLRYDLTNTRWEMLNPAAPVAVSQSEAEAGTETALRSWSPARVAQAVVAQSYQNGQCELVKSGSDLVLLPKNGNKIFINGAAEEIPSAGVSLAPTSLTPGTNYYIYAYMSGATMTLEASATTHATDTTYGNEIKNGDATRSLVGFARCDTGPAWVDTNSTRWVRSWFNSPSVSGRNATSASSPTTSSSSYVALDTTNLRVSFLSWADEHVSVSFSGVASINTDNADIKTTLYVDGAASSGGGFAVHNRSAYSALSANNHHVSTHDDMSEGYHYVDVMGAVSAGTGTWTGGSSPNRSLIHFMVSK